MKKYIAKCNGKGCSLTDLCFNYHKKGLLIAPFEIVNGKGSCKLYSPKTIMQSLNDIFSPKQILE